MAQYPLPTDTYALHHISNPLLPIPNSDVNVVVIGATGATGRYLVAELLLASENNIVTIVARKKYEFPLEYNSLLQVLNASKDRRLVEHILDLESITDEQLRDIFEGVHAFFNCLGTTKGIAGSRERFIQIDMDIPQRFARIAKEKRVKHASLLSSSGSNQKSLIFYLKVKGLIEAGFRNLEFPVLSIWKPGPLGRREYARFSERVFGIFSHPLPTDDLARAMVQESLQIIRGLGTSNYPTTYLNSEIKRLNFERLNELKNIPFLNDVDKFKSIATEGNIEVKQNNLGVGKIANNLDLSDSNVLCSGDIDALATNSRIENEVILNNDETKVQVTTLYNVDVDVEIKKKGDPKPV